MAKRMDPVFKPQGEVSGGGGQKMLLAELPTDELND